MSFVFRTGKHKGKSLQLVQKIDPGYIDWVKENRPEMLEEKEIEIKPRTPAPRIEPPEENENKPKGLQPNLNFWNEGPNGKQE